MQGAAHAPGQYGAPAHSQWRFPAEWEPQSAVLLAWPHAGTDWAERLDFVENAYAGLIQAITRFQPVILCVADASVCRDAQRRLHAASVDPDRLRLVEVEYDDTWLRDSGPMTLVSASGKSVVLLDFRFTGWGGKFDASRDDRLIEALGNAGVFADAARWELDFALEGGAVETDGQGTLLTTWRCLQARHPGETREALTGKLCNWFHQDRVLWLEHGALEGDDTDAHIDTLARFAATDAIVFQACDDPADAHYLELQAMQAELAAFRTRDDRPYRLFPLPWPRPIVEEGRRLAASYANFLVVNGAVLMPAYDDPADTTAAEVLAAAFPDRQIVPVPCRPLIWQNGSLHCLTMQLPKGLV